VSEAPNTRDPLAVVDERNEADRLALEVYGPAAKSLGYRVRVQGIAGSFGIFLVVPED
jgi:hypothetical protein